MKSYFNAKITVNERDKPETFYNILVKNYQFPLIVKVSCDQGRLESSRDQ